ncbi:glucosaminidase domain-containing protein [Cellulophaga baltica]|uniref:glucosaminidase domain-containing protein n=1 Tax=Cellulophaga TaxID=104264 RepID=UPI001C0677DC|nr:MULTISPECIES: glucosaminidase domain-containing protein [Cellulophaga]MBU2995348.1 glucosaminidase domain-containing protein [Cellulophaga baltica]MDO6766743.1 glucosaminidase domain-containing protein [Cellulophaga sp. 1_MG-2023]
MIKKITILAVLIVFTACKSHKRTTNTTSSSSTTAHKSEKLEEIHTDNGDVYVLPEDSGEFVKFPINSVEEYIATFAEIAQFEMKAYGIPASITLAQGILESGAGRSTLVKKTNNHFGIKCHTGWKGDYDFHDDDEKGECFRKYNHPMYSFRDHSEFLSSRARYSFLFDLDNDDYRNWAKGLKQAGYATDRKYPSKLISFIEQYQLYKYDAYVRNAGYKVTRTAKEYEVKSHTVVKGDTLYSISRRYFISVDEIMKMNNLKNSNLAVGQKLVVKTLKK